MDNETIGKSISNFWSHEGRTHEVERLCNVCCRLCLRTDLLFLVDFPPGAFFPGTFNPYTAWEHLEAITKEPHNFNTRANTDVTKKYIRDQFKDLVAEAIATGRRNVRYEDQDNTTWAKIYKSRQQREEEQDPSTALAQDALERELVEYVQGDNLLMWVGGVVESEEDGVPVKIEIDVNQPNQNALLVSSHYGKRLWNKLYATFCHGT
jgi:hypothetical protein